MGGLPSPKNATFDPGTYDFRAAAIFSTVGIGGFFVDLWNRWICQAGRIRIIIHHTELIDMIHSTSVYMDVSKNRVSWPPKSSILMTGFPLFSPSILGAHLFF